MSDDERMSAGSDEEQEEEPLNSDISGDGQLTKEIITRGKGYKTPAKGAEVTVHYVGTLLDGTQFDSSRDRGEYFKFKLGQGQVIRGWDEGVATMKKGEKAILTCAPDYAYGARGSPPTIPPNATLKFEVELFSWQEWQDISEKHDGTVMQKILKEGEGWDHPTFDTNITLSWKIFGDNKEAVVTRDDHQFLLGAEEVPSVLEVALEKVKKGEKSRITIAGKAIPADERKKFNIPEGLDPVKFEIEVKDFEKVKESWNLKNDEKIKMAEQKKTEGNELFKIGNLRRAEKKYELALSYVRSDYDMTDEVKAQAKQLKITLESNLAAVALKRQNWNDVKKHCNSVLESAPGNTKALLRRGRAFLEQEDYTSARSDLNDVINTTGAAEIAEAKKELARLNAKVQAQTKKERGLFANMFDKIRLDSDEKRTGESGDTVMTPADEDEAKVDTNGSSQTFQAGPTQES